MNNDNMDWKRVVDEREAQRVAEEQRRMNEELRRIMYQVDQPPEPVEPAENYTLGEFDREFLRRMNVRPW